MCHLCRAEDRAQMEHLRRNRYTPNGILDFVMTLAVFGGIWALFYLLVRMT
jgi:hypothetical protein